MPTDFPEVNQLIGDNITEGDFKVGIAQFLSATEERIGDMGSVSNAISDVRAVAESKQSKLTAGNGISISGSTISAELIVEPYAIGSYAFAGYKENINASSSVTVSAGTIKSGSSLFFGTLNTVSVKYDVDAAAINAAVSSGGGESRTGTWKLMHRAVAKNSNSSKILSVGIVGLWQRIA